MSVKKFPLELIIWDDAESGDGWEEIPTEKLEPKLCYTIGYKLMETPAHILIAATVDKDGETCNNRLQIPKAMIQSRVPLGEITDATGQGTTEVAKTGNKRRKNAGLHRGTRSNKR